MTCAKQQVTATLVLPDDRRFVGTNAVAKPQAVCPRGDMPSGQGYHLCREICRQPHHAEMAALKAAGGYAEGATLYLEGHTYVCTPCKLALGASGVSKVIFGAPPA